MRSARALLFIVTLSALGACGGSDGLTTTTPGGTTGGTTPVVTTSVSLLNIAFTPAAIKVSPGATVTFTNQDNITHNVTFTQAGITGSGDFATGSKSITMPATAGTYAYHCTIHPTMTGSVLVQ